MVYHMLAVFGEESARPPTGLCESGVHRPHHVLSEEEEVAHKEVCQKLLDQCYFACKSSSRRVELLGHGSGFTYECTPYCCSASDAAVHVLFAGEVSEWPGVDAVSAAHDAFVRDDPPLEANDAHWLLDFYSTFPTATAAVDLQERALECLSKIQGSFAFVIYDEARRRVLAARDSTGAQPMYWGSTPDGQLMFGSCIEDLSACQPTATSFPAGTLFASERHMLAYNPGERGWVIADDDYPGQLLSFLKADAQHWRSVKAIPRITSKGVMCGTVYRVASQADMPGGVSSC